MTTALTILIGVIAALHVWFLVLEMFLWRTPFAWRRFRSTQEQANQTYVLAMNQGLYNGFLAAGLIWGLVCEPSMRRDVQLFFLSCVAVAGVFGGATAFRFIFFVQALPALVAIGLLFAS